MINAPWPPLLLAGILVAIYALQTAVPALTERYALIPPEVAAGRWETLITAVFLHFNWPHALLNSAMILAFGAPLSRFFGERPLGALAFLGFFVAVGAIANLAFIWLHHGQYTGAVGASGAAAGLMAAAARLMAGRGRIGPIFSRIVLGMGAAWIAINLLVALVGSWFVPGTDGASIGWEIHIAGFLVGVFLISPFAWVARRG